MDGIDKDDGIGFGLESNRVLVCVGWVEHDVSI